MNALELFELESKLEEGSRFLSNGAEAGKGKLPEGIRYGLHYSAKQLEHAASCIGSLRRDLETWTFLEKERAAKASTTPTGSAGSQGDP